MKAHLETSGCLGSYELQTIGHDVYHIFILWINKSCVHSDETLDSGVSFLILSNVLDIDISIWCLSFQRILLRSVSSIDFFENELPLTTRRCEIHEMAILFHLWFVDRHHRHWLWTPMMTAPMELVAIVDHLHYIIDSKFCITQP
jgi:hypothetical protein